MLNAANINKKIAGKKILEDISISLESGEIISIIGPSGAGKTSLLRAISLIDFPDSGSLKINGNSYQFPIQRAESVKFPYPNLTIVFQQLFIWPHLTIRQNITLPLRRNVDGVHFAGMVKLFQMDSFLDRYPNEISMGQRQKAALVRALLLKPSCLLLDEITSALDAEQSHQIFCHLKQIAKRGAGIVIVSHDLRLISKISDRVIFFDKGKIVEEGARGIITNPKTDRLKKFVNIPHVINN